MKKPKHSTGAASRLVRPLPGPKPQHSTGTASQRSRPLPKKHSTGKASHLVRALPSKKPKKPRRLPLGEAVACCSAEAVAMSLRLAGQRVTDADVLALYFATADSPDDGASIEDTLDAAARFGLACRFSGSGPLAGDVLLAVDVLAATAPHAALLAAPALAASSHLGSVILGIALPEGPHAVLATDAGWWSWGELYDPAEFGGAVIEEAWAVTW